MRVLCLLFGLCVFCTHVYSQDLPADKNATKETVHLYHNLKRILNKGILFGHQDDLAYGVNWKYEKDRSDVKDVAGDYPAVYGWELGRLELDQTVNLDSVPFNKMRQFIKEGYSRGAIITISWHLNNPLTGKTAWDPAPGTVASILPGGEKNELYKSWLDKVAAFLQSLRSSNGEWIPVIFRPFHELNGSWFWWGKNHCTANELIKAYQFTVTYLRDNKNIHNLLYAFNTDRFSSEAEFLERYPGNDWVDIIGFDIYQRSNDNAAFIHDIDHMLSMLEKTAMEKSKIPALTEFGYNNIPDNTWWTQTFWKGVGNHHISYVLGWRNAGAKAGGDFECYVPYKGHNTEKDFVEFYKNERTLFEKEIAKERVYQ